jgi:hypothetical protein
VATHFWILVNFYSRVGESMHETEFISSLSSVRSASANLCLAFLCFPAFSKEFRTGCGTLGVLLGKYGLLFL